MSTSTFTTDYSKDFDGKSYEDAYYGEINDDPESLDFLIKEFHEIFHNRKVSGKVLLEIGTGPIILNAICACPYVQDIYLSDYIDSNRRMLQEWKENKLQYGKNLCKSVLDIEDGPTKPTIDDRFSDTRQKIRRIIHVDVKQNPPIDLNVMKYPQIIMTSFCLESACLTIEEYVKAVKNISDLQSPGGHIVVAGELGGTFYMAGKSKFPCLNINGVQVKKAFGACGYEIRHWAEFTHPGTQPMYDFKKEFVLYAVKL